MITTNLGFPRIGRRRALKAALEKHWSEASTEKDLLEAARLLRCHHWQLQKQIGIDHIPSNDFSLYDHVLDTVAMVGAVPRRYGDHGERVSMTTYFEMARGQQVSVPSAGVGSSVVAMEMTKWFDTNYHYIVPEFTPDQRFCMASLQPIEMFLEAKALGIHTRPVLLGPVSFLLLGKMTEGGALGLLDRLIPVYEEILGKLMEAGADWVQLDEPFLACDLSSDARSAFHQTYDRLGRFSSRLRVLIATYFEGLRDNLEMAFRLPVAAWHLDLVRAPYQLDAALSAIPSSRILSLGVVNGRNIWKTDLTHATTLVQQAITKLGSEQVWIAPSCSLLHVPLDLEEETALDPRLHARLSFAKQKLEEIVAIAQAIRGRGRAPAVLARQPSSEAAASPFNREEVRARVASISDRMLARKSPYAERSKCQQKRFNLPLLPTTTIGSFPQTPEIRAARAAWKSGNKTDAAYRDFLRDETAKAVRIQETLDIDVLVHGEFERNDMVEYFGEQLDGFAFTQQGWVQSYGSRCVKPPILFGDVSRSQPMTVEWSRYAQSLTSRPIKGMLTGPITILKWSFVREDQPLSETACQLALAIRDEVTDLEAAGIGMIQIDEPALREGLPLRRADWKEYLTWSVDAFRLATAGVRDETQIHTHMCYAEFNDIMEAIARMDADVISIETSRSHMALLSAFQQYRYPNAIGPGVYDVHSPQVPAEGEIEALLGKALVSLSPAQLWVNPDCGLKTRKWEETSLALSAMVASARKVRAGLGTFK